MLDLRRLQILAAVHTEGTMTAAAGALCMTTSAVSQQIALLEKEVALPLLIRTGRTVRLNEAGLTLLHHLSRIASEVEAAETSLDRFRSDVHGRVVVSAFPSFCSIVLPEALVNLRRSHPGLDVAVRDLEPIESISLLRSGDVDVAVVDDLQEIPGEGLVSTHLAHDDLVLCLPPDRDPLPDAAPLEECSGERWVLDAQGSAFEAHTRRLCAEAGFEPRVVAYCGHIGAGLALVQAGFGITLMSTLHLGPAPSGVTIRRVEPPARRRVLAVTREARHPSPALGAVVGELQARARAHYVQTRTRRDTADVQQRLRPPSRFPDGPPA